MISSRAALYFLLGTVPLGMVPPAAQAFEGDFCQATPAAIAQKNQARQAALASQATPEARAAYEALLRQQAIALQECRRQSPIRRQAIWLRLHSCDLRPDNLELVLDRIVDRGYNHVYVETIFDGRVLLPQAENQTVWRSVIDTPGLEQADLWQRVLERGRRRGLRVYGWVHTLNFGFAYGQRPDRREAIARNGKGQSTIEVLEEQRRNPDTPVLTTDQTFADPYSEQARNDLLQALRPLLQRRPDGVLFDYVRYKRSVGSASVVSNVRSLWVYGSSSQAALLDRATNGSGRELLQRFLRQGFLTDNDLRQVRQAFPKEREPLWQGRPTPPPTAKPRPWNRISLSTQLWQLAISHAFRGVLEFVATATAPVQQQGIPAGVVFFPEGNRAINSGWDSRLQPWNQFPSTLEWHPMVYAACGQVDCIAAQVTTVVAAAAEQTAVLPVLIGRWGERFENRPPLEAQMRGIRAVAPRVTGFSHFAFNWQEPELERSRRTCSPPRS
jgi:hypothetical protein